MPSRLALTALILLCAAHADAGSLCHIDSVSSDKLKEHCDDPGNPTFCHQYYAQIVGDCTEEIDETKTFVNKLPKDPDKRTQDEKLRAIAAKGRYGSIIVTLLDIQDKLTELAKDNGENGPLPGIVALEGTNEGIAGGINAAFEAINRDLPPEFKGGDEEPLPRSSTVLDQANKAPPQKAVEIISQAGEQALAGGRVDDAEKLGENLVQRAPSDYRGPSLLAEAAIREGRPADAERWAKKALALNPRDKRAQDTLSIARSDLSAQKLKKPVVGNFSEARTQELAKNIAAGEPPPRPTGPPGAPGASPSPEAAAKAADPVPRVLAGLLRRGYEKMNLGDLPGALEDVSVHLDSHPEDGGARLIRAEILLKLGKPALALADIDAALAKAPDDPRGLRARAAALYEIGGRDPEALTTIERALAIEPASGIGHLTRAKILERLGRIPEAIVEYRTAAQLDPTLEPVVEAALRRLGATPPPSKAVEKGLLRGGFLIVSLALILMGLVGGAVVATRRARTAEAAAAAAERTLKGGDLVAGQYRITRELGRGGMGVVFEAVDEKLKRPVALKQLQGEFRASAEDAARFLQEARLVAQLRHPNVAEIYAAVEDGGLFLVFELVRGRSLDTVLGAGVTPEQARGIVAHACAALTAAHASRIVHRDLKPSNMMISDEGQLKVMDFGIAHQSLRGGAFTQTSASGTPPYMAPEQAMGSVSAASDLYALGVMTYELLSGVRPFAGPDFLGPKMRGEFAPVTSRRAALPARLDGFFASALSPDPTRRPKDAAAFAAAFAACWS